MLFPKQRLEIFHQQEQVVRICRAGLEIESLVPGACFIVLGVNEKGANAGDVRGLRGSQKSILEQGFAKTASVLRLMNGKAPKEHDRDGVLGESPSHSSGRVFMFDRADSETVIANDPLLPSTNNVGLSTSCLLVHQREPLQKAI